MKYVAPTTSQMRALAYAPKPFAALSFLASISVMYYLLIRHPEKRKRMYHRLVFYTFICFLPLSFCMFWGTWALPVGSVPWAVGVSGTELTCSIQGFLVTAFFMAFPIYYASIGVLANVALKNDFQEEKYAWMEKWVHVTAYLVPLSVAIYAAANNWISPGATVCYSRSPVIDPTCDDPGMDPNCARENGSVFSVFISVWVFISLLVGTVLAIYLLCTFDKARADANDAVGMNAIIGTARKRKLKLASLQVGLYLASFWFGYIPAIVEHVVRDATDTVNYELIVTSHCIFACQGFVVAIIYFALLPKRDNLVESLLPQVSAHNEETVSIIRANAARPRSMKHASVNSIASGFSFIFDGRPSDDSPWRSYLEEALDPTVVEEPSISDS